MHVSASSNSIIGNGYYFIPDHLDIIRDQLKPR